MYPARPQEGVLFKPEFISSAEGRLPWVDFTRRNDPAHPSGVLLLEEHLCRDGYPRVLCFWTKAPNVLQRLYSGVIRRMQRSGTLVLAQVTLNHYSDLEPGLRGTDRDLRALVALLGSHRVRLRFDPIIPGYTTPQHFKRTLQAAVENGIKRVTVNFVVTRYRGVGPRLEGRGIGTAEISDERKIEILSQMISLLPAGVDLAICAETASLNRTLPSLKRAACADPEWAEKLDPTLSGVFKRRPSRKGCGCVYSADWGLYAGRGGHVCPQGCLYCYAR